MILLCNCYLHSYFTPIYRENTSIILKKKKKKEEEEEKERKKRKEKCDEHDDIFSIQSNMLD